MSPEKKLYIGLRYAHKKLNFICKKKKIRKMFVCVQNSIFCCWKKNFFGAIFQNYLKNFLCRHEKMPVIQFPYVEIVWKEFFSNFFCHQSVQLFSKSRRKFFNFCSTVFRKCMKIVRQAVLHTLDVWICIIVIFVAWCCIISTFPEPGSSVQFQINAHWLRTWLTEFLFFHFYL